MNNNMSKPISIRMNLPAEAMAALLRFAETCEDGEGYDVPKPMMSKLAKIGLLQHVGGGIYTTTEMGDEALRCAELAATPSHEGIEP